MRGGARLGTVTWKSENLVLARRFHRLVGDFRGFMETFGWERRGLSPPSFRLGTTSWRAPIGGLLVQTFFGPADAHFQVLNVA